jgi:hypothetical protein
VITGDQIVAHLVGDYILQSDWMANEKTKRSVAALAHALCYSLPFLFLRPSLAAWAFIVATHFVIDRWRLARYVCWLKNLLAPGTVMYRTDWNGEESTFTPTRWNRFQVAEWRSDWQKPWRECAATGYHPSRPIWLATWLLIVADNAMHLICNGIALRWL